VKIYNFDLLAYPHVPTEAPRTPVPSSYFDPLKGAANYKEHLEEMTYCEELGFDGVVFNEHHYSALNDALTESDCSRAESEDKPDQNRRPRKHFAFAQSSRSRRRRVCDD